MLSERSISADSSLVVLLRARTRDGSSSMMRFKTGNLQTREV